MVEVGGKIAVFQLQDILIKVNFIQHYTCWIYVDLGIILVYFIMQNYPFSRAWNEADWLDPLWLRSYRI